MRSASGLHHLLYFRLLKCNKLYLDHRCWRRSSAHLLERLAPSSVVFFILFGPSDRAERTGCASPSIVVSSLHQTGRSFITPVGTVSFLILFVASREINAASQLDSKTIFFLQKSPQNDGQTDRSRLANRA